ncbi:hypothetical protein MM817_03209 [Acidibacillus sp. S0AB]|uniref:Isoprenylcysteine carboxylmethyltransferase family protein n=2 Tax=Sulfoacidibacillus ferrooxidans TaxID=2005001 RepID=A0A9X1VF73_9BACL|nr:hypothetical protein [Sulfoacidibacillus ferrooxidans]
MAVVCQTGQGAGMLWFTFFVWWTIVFVVLIGSSLLGQIRGQSSQMHNRRTSFIWIPYGLVLWILVDVIPHRVWIPITFSRIWLAALGDSIVLIGMAWVLWARWTLGRNFTQAPVITETHRLITTGPYRVTRHPIYTGILAMLFGSMLFYGFGATVVILLATWGVFVVKLRAEERLLIERYVDKYIAYQQNTPQLIPIVRHLTINEKNR